MKMHGKYLRVMAAVGITTTSLSMLPASAVASGGSGAVHATLLITAGDPSQQVLQTLMAEYAKIHPGSTLTVTQIVQSSVDQKLTLDASAGDLPTIFIGPQSPTQQGQFGTEGYSLNIQTALTSLGVYNDLNPAAVKILKTLEGGLYAIPDQLAMEGFWYNKKIFAQNNITPPTTWSAMVSDAAALEAKGIQPFAADGSDGWPLTRLISGYIFRDLGPNALLKVKDGTAKLTDPQYVAAAQQVADLGAKGYFGKGFATLDYSAAEAEFLDGEAAMFYMGSWALPDFANPKLSEIGASDVGYFPVPAVAGGAGAVTDTPMNCGEPLMFSAKAYNAADAQWLKFVAENFGNVALKQGDITGFEVLPKVTTATPLMQIVQHQIAVTTTPVLWFEAYFSSKATTVAQSDAAPLVDGGMSAQQYMSNVQAALDS